MHADTGEKPLACQFHFHKQRSLCLDPRVKPEDDAVWVAAGGKREYGHYDPAPIDHPYP